MNGVRAVFLSLFLVTGHRNFLLFAVLEFYVLYRSILTYNYYTVLLILCNAQVNFATATVSHVRSAATTPNHIDGSRNQTEVTIKIYVTLDDKSRLISAS